MDGGEEVSCGFVIARSDGAELFEFGEEVFDQVARLVEFPVVAAGLEPFGAWWDNGRFTCTPERFQNAGLRIEAFIGDHRSGLKPRQQDIGPIQFARLAAGQMHIGRVPQCIHCDVDLGA